MSLCFWNNGAPRIVKNTRKVKVLNGDTIMGAKADPDLDLYVYVDAGPRPGRFENAGPVSYDNDGWTVTATRSVVAWSADRIVAAKKQDVKNRRDMVRDAGIEHGVYIVQTDGDSRREMTGAVVSINEGALTEMAWRMLDNTVAMLPAADFKVMALTVSAHVQACYVRQAELEAEIGASADPASVDTDAGWPVHYVAPEIV